MSRHTASNEDGEKFVYGFDSMLAYYFLDRVLPDGDWEGLCVGPAVGPGFQRVTRGFFP
jgi:hypothetical protein